MRTTIFTIVLTMLLAACADEGPYDYVDCYGNGDCSKADVCSTAGCIDAQKFQELAQSCSSASDCACRGGYRCTCVRQACFEIVGDGCWSNGNCERDCRNNCDGNCAAGTGDTCHLTCQDIDWGATCYCSGDGECMKIMQRSSAAGSAIW